MPQIQQTLDTENPELDPYYLEAKLFRLENENKTLKGENRRLNEEKQKLEAEQSLLSAQAKQLEGQVKQLGGQVAALKDREDPKARQRIEFLRDETVSLIRKSVKLQRNALKSALPPKEGETEDAVVDAWEQDAVSRVENQWTKAARGTFTAFFGALFGLYKAVFDIFSGLGLLFAKGVVKAEIAVERVKWRQEKDQERQSWNRSMKNNLTQLDREKRRQQQALAEKTKKVNQELDEKTKKVNRDLDARKRELDERKKKLENKEKQLEAKLKALKRWRIAALLLLVLSAGSVFLILYYYNL